MTECSTDGCTNPAEVVVEFTDPDEEVGYCPPCGWHNFRRNQNATTMEKS